MEKREADSFIVIKYKFNIEDYFFVKQEEELNFKMLAREELYHMKKLQNKTFDTTAFDETYST